jgi:hypothetical protein
MKKNVITLKQLIRINKYKKEPIRAQEKIIQTLELLLLDKNFEADINKIKNKHKLEKIIGEKDGISIIRLTPEFDKDVEKLIRKYNLSGIYLDFLKSFCCNINLSHTAGIYILPAPDLEIDKKQKCLLLKIYPETTIKDIQFMWPEIQEDLHKTIKCNTIKNRISNNLQRDIEIYKLKLSGMKQMEIKNIINEKYLNSRIEYQEIPKIIARLKKATRDLIPS